jgi:hypothetical protein
VTPLVVVGAAEDVDVDQVVAVGVWMTVRRARPASSSKSPVAREWSYIS